MAKTVCKFFIRFSFLGRMLETGHVVRIPIGLHAIWNSSFPNVGLFNKLRQNGKTLYEPERVLAVLRNALHRRLTVLRG
jgi:hypothetical protein